MNYSFVSRSIDNTFFLVSESAFRILDNNSLDGKEKDMLFDKVGEIRACLEHIEKCWEKICKLDKE